MKAVALLVLLAAPLPAGARPHTTVAPEPVVDPGARVRVTLLARPDAPVIGTLRALSPGTIEIEDSTARSIPRPDVARLEVSRGKRMHTKNHAALGVLAGAAVGAVLGARVGAGQPSGLGSNDVLLGVFGGVLGGLVGGGIGSAGGRRVDEERWREVRLP
jgi:hypothetical protein